MTKNAKITITVVIMTLIVALIGVSCFYIVKSYAYWAEKSNDIEELEVPLDEDFNPSEKHIIFYGIDDSGNFVSDANAVSYAVVGYKGMVAEVTIPETHNGKSVTCILAPPTEDGVRYAFRNNTTITTLIIPSSVVRIGKGACSDMSFLKKVVVEGTSGSLEMGTGAFMGCRNLTTFDVVRDLTGDTVTWCSSTGLV